MSVARGAGVGAGAGASASSAGGGTQTGRSGVVTAADARAPKRGLTAAAKASAMLLALEERFLKGRVLVSDRCHQEDIVRHFQAAGDAYVVNGKWRQAGIAYGHCGDAMVALDRYRAAAALYVQAARAMEKVDPEGSIVYFTKATEQYAAVGYWLKCASMQLTVARLYERDGAFEDSSEAYQSAADFFVSVGMYPQAVRCLVTSAAFLADQDAYELAAQKFDAAVSHCLDHNLLKLNAPSIMLNAVLCWVCVGSLGAAYKQVGDYSDVDYGFAASRERRFLLDVMDCAKFYDLDEYIDHVWNFDYAVKLKPYQLRMLERVFLIIEAGAPEARALLKRKAERNAAAAAADDSD